MYWIVATGPRVGQIVDGGLVRAEEVAIVCDGGAYDPAQYPDLADRLYLYPKGVLPDLRGI